MQISKLNFEPTCKYYADNCKSIDGSRILITGGTGFVGKWLIESLIQISQHFNLKIEIVVTTRDVNKNKNLFSNYPHLSIVQLDLTSSFQSLGEFTHVIHASSPTSKTLNTESTVLEASFNSAKNIIATLNNKSATPVFIHTSSGAVYDINKIGVTPQPLRTRSALVEYPKNFSEEYKNAKIKTEEFVELNSSLGNIHGINARLFAFYGPYLSTRSHYAIGNFMQSAVSGEAIEVKSLGESYRSYMHASELSCQLIYLMSNANVTNCDIGSDFGKPISWWANYIGQLFDLKVRILGEIKEEPTYYVPNLNFEIPRLEYACNNMDLLFKQWFDWLKLDKN
jgi:nucleoside-diphosphate-sugar epimerase